jgi:hypothetical protein
LNIDIRDAGNLVRRRANMSNARWVQRASAWHLEIGPSTLACVWNYTRCLDTLALIPSIYVCISVFHAVLVDIHLIYRT